MKLIERIMKILESVGFSDATHKFVASIFYPLLFFYNNNNFHISKEKK